MSLAWMVRSGVTSRSSKYTRAGLCREQQVCADAVAVLGVVRQRVLLRLWRIVRAAERLSASGM